MDNFERLSTGQIWSECQLYLLLSASCGCLQGYLFENLTTLETKTGREWLAIFIADPPDCDSGGGDATTTYLATADTITTITDAAITGTVVGIIGNGGQTWSTGFTTVGDTVTLTDGSNFVPTERYLLFLI